MTYVCPYCLQEATQTQDETIYICIPCRQALTISDDHETLVDYQKSSSVMCVYEYKRRHQGSWSDREQT